MEIGMKTNKKRTNKKKKRRNLLLIKKLYLSDTKNTIPPSENCQIRARTE
jgi:hypothetical protein